MSTIFAAACSASFIVLNNVGFSNDLPSITTLAL
jgi:hypothetical protein